MRRLAGAVVSGCLVFSVVAAPVAVARTKVVDCGHGASLQAAIDAARPGTTLEVHGTCRGNFVITKDLRLTGRGHRPTLDGGGSGTVVTVPPGPGGPIPPRDPQPTGATVLITGLTIRRGDRGMLDRGTVTLTRSTVRDNGTGIDVLLDFRVAGGLTLDHSRVRDNTGNGINSGRGPLLVKDSVIADNGGVGFSSDIATVLRSTIRDNGGAGIDSIGALLVLDSVVRGNQRGGITSYGFIFSELHSRTYVTMRRSRVVGNSTPGDGGGIRSRGRGGPDRQLSISDSVIAGNHAAGEGGGIYAWGDGINLDLDHVVIRDNIAAAGGGIYEAGGSSSAGAGRASLTDVTFSNNTPDDCYGC